MGPRQESPDLDNLVEPIGGMNGSRKWLKDRRERRLELDDIRIYCRIVTALNLTIDMQMEIDALSLEIDKQPLPLPGLSKT